MISFRALLYNLLALAACIVMISMLIGALTNPEYQGGLTARYQAREQTRRVEAREWGATARTWAQWGGLALAVGVGAWCVVMVSREAGRTITRWQEERTRREELQQAGTTQRTLIGAQRDVAIAWIEQHGTRNSYAGVLDGAAGVFVPERGEFWPLAACEAQLAGYLPVAE